MKRKRTGTARIAHALISDRASMIDEYRDPSPATIAYIAGFRHLAERLADKGHNVSTLPDIPIEQICQDFARVADIAEPWFITDEMATMVQIASETMPPHQMSKYDPPSHSGWLIFDHPLTFEANDGKPILTYGMVWTMRTIGDPRRGQPESYGFVIYGLSTPQQWAADSGDPYAASLVSQMPRLPYLIGTIGTNQMGRLPWKVLVNGNPDIGHDPYVAAAVSSYYSQTSWADESPPLPRGEIVKDGTDDGMWGVRTPSGNLASIEPDPADRWLLAFFRLLRQELPAVTSEPIPASLSRRLRNAGHLAPDAVTIVSWRKREAGQCRTDTGRTLHYRHVRRGHWRMNNRRKINGRWARYPVWIEPTIVGDPSLPMKHRTVVNAVTR